MGKQTEQGNISIMVKADLECKQHMYFHTCGKMCKANQWDARGVQQTCVSLCSQGAGRQFLTCLR